MAETSFGARSAAVAVSLIAALVLSASPGPAENKPASDLDCLALNIYFEARGEPLQGKLAVGYVVINRVGDEEFPANVCQVVQQGGEAVRYRCQFSWWCDGRSDKPVDLVAWRESREAAWEILSGTTKDPTRGALWYHADYVQPDWQDELVKIHKIGDHLFYRRPEDSRWLKPDLRWGQRSRQLYPQ